MQSLQKKYPRIPWDPVVNPLGCIVHTVGAIALGKLLGRSTAFLESIPCSFIV